YQGVMPLKIKQSFESSQIATDSFKTAIANLYDAAQNDFKNFFDKYSDLKGRYDMYVESEKNDENEKMNAILEMFMPSIKKKLKQLFIKQSLVSSVGIDSTIASQLLEKSDVMHSIKDKIDDNDIDE